MQPAPAPSPVDTAAAALTGPYTAIVNGSCALGHPVNGYGRCAELNTGLEQQVVAHVAVG